MIDFPKSTIVHQRLPKEAFYQHLSLSAALKAKFISDIDRILVENSLTKSNLNLAKDSEINEIMLLSISLKKQNFDSKIVEAIAKQNPHQLVFLLTFEDKYQFAVYRNKLYRTQWMKKEELSLELHGDTLDEIWDDLVRQIVITSESLLERQDQSLEEQLEIQDEINRLNKLIKKTEAAAWKEQQPKKKFEIYQELKRLKSELAQIKAN
ncbi:MAG: DUF4391 domain-containing protein [Eubacteriaceae bacterium]|uniref:DUF4391 domain-containing protein n=1 Tax=Candidatus Pseudoramibacter fermentans TaxID=2594427 RepID=A0A6L5GPL9_9FIRM|nr:DUF4391 domain-containing protein [Candidatus Pseudoramibacter fermentans]RRF92539.1 MAG: DUF4391 domain-containing protein [Eubacteriaceae bacterium]